MSLRESEMPAHTHRDSGHSHRFVYNTNSGEGLHAHTYKDIFFSESPNVQELGDYRDYVDVPKSIGNHKHWDFDNKGMQITRTSYSEGYHSHKIDGDSYTSRAILEQAGGYEAHENRQPFFTAIYIIYLYN